MRYFFKSIFVILVFQLIAVWPAQAEVVDSNVEEWLEQSDTPSDQPSQTPGEQENEVESFNNTITIWDIVKLIFTTIFIIVFIYFILKLINKRGKLFNQYKYLENLGGTSLGTNRSIQLVKVGERVLVLGVGESVQLIKEISDDEEINNILQEHNAKLDNLMQPNNLFNKIAQIGNSKDKEDKKFSLLLKEQLSEINTSRKKILEQFEQKGSRK
jgi:flagellar protein FliO/FliZ